MKFLYQNLNLKLKLFQIPNIRLNIRKFSVNKPISESPSSDTPVTTADSENNVDIFAAAISGPTEVSSFPSWYEKMKEHLASGKGPFYLGNKTPFPFNQEFRPQKPITNEFREKILLVWQNDPEKWTPRQLSMKFKVSIERVKAIIKLKLLERKMVEGGFKINKKFIAKMEENLGSSVPINAEKIHPIPSIIDNIQPKLIAIPEESNLSSEEAAKLIGKDLKPIHQWLKRELDGEIPFVPNREDTEKINMSELLIRNDPYEASKWKFVFVDTSTNVNQKENQVFIREGNGDLRFATPRERIFENNRAKENLAIQTKGL